MKRLQASEEGTSRIRHAGRSGFVRGAVLSLACFLGGIALTAAWVSRTTPNAPVDPAGASLSPATKSVLRRLDFPVELRFYSVLDNSSADPSYRAFAERVEQLIALYQDESGGKMRVSRGDSFASEKAALGDGILPFNMDKGPGCYLGIAAVAQGRKQALARLAPEWEPALESDLTRMLASLADAGQATQPRVRVDTASIDAVRQTIPNVDSVSLERGGEALRASALEEFQKAAAQMQAELEQARENLVQSQDGQSGSAPKRLQEIQAEQSAKLRQIGINYQAQIAALRQIKKDTR